MQSKKKLLAHLHEQNLQKCPKNKAGTLIQNKILDWKILEIGYSG